MKHSFLSISILSFLVLISQYNPVFGNEKTLPIQQKVNQEVENIYKKAISHYLEKRYDVVEWELRELLNIHPKNHRLSTILYLIGRAQYKQQKYNDAEQTLLQFVKQFPNSAFIDDTNFILAAISFDQKRYVSSSEYLFAVLEKTDDNRLQTKVFDLLPPLLTDYLKNKDYDVYKNRYSENSSQFILTFAQGISLYRQKKYDLAKEQFLTLVNDLQSYPFNDRSEKYLQLIEMSSNESLKIGVILPLSGFFKDEAKSLLAGIEYAIQNNPSFQNLGLELVVKDSQGEAINTIQVCQELIEDENVIAIIGEIESDMTAIIASLASKKSIPVITPTAAEVELTNIGNNVIQMSPDVSIRGEMIAEYAINELNLKSFVILAPADKYGRTITDSFAETVDRLNGTILAESWYYQGATELRNQFKNIRDIGLKKMKRDSVAFEMPDLTISQIDSIIAEAERLKRLEAVLENIPPKMKFADSTAIPVTSIDAIFLPVYPEEIPYVAPQFALYNIQCQLLGGDYWNDEDILDDNETYVSGTIFSSDLFVDVTDPRYQQFRNQFRLEMGITPEKMEIYGYDVMNFIIDVFDEKTRTAEDFLTNLSKSAFFRGLLHMYQFDKKSRVNSYLNILRYDNNTIEKLK